MTQTLTSLVKIPDRQAYYLLLWLAFGLLLFRPQPLQAQELAAIHGLTKHDKENPQQKEQDKRMLEDVLQEVGEKYKTSFVFENKVVQGKRIKISKEDLNMSPELEPLLEKLLSPLNLGYEKFSNYYIIQARQEQKSKSVDKIEKMPLRQGASSSSTIPVHEFSTWKRRTLEKTITGTVTDGDNDEPLPGVNVIVKNTTIGTVTDLDGNYRLTAPDDAETLVYSSVGYSAQEVSINNRSVINISLMPDIQSLSEVVVVGYGTLKEREVVSSINTVKAEQIERVPTPSFTQALQGTSSGLQVSTAGGEPNASTRILIRGVSSITTDTEPLFIVDGVPVASGGTSPLNYLSPNDIESVSVLKDASATAIYGSRGANGVVLITTKMGTEGQATFDVGYQRGVTTPINQLELANADQWRGAIAQARQTSGLADQRFPKEQDLFDFRQQQRFVDLNIYDQTNTDWVDLAQQDGSFDQYTFSASNATDKFSFYVSGQYRDQAGNFIGTRFQRYTGRINFDFTPVDFMKIGLRYQYSREIEDRRGPGPGTASNLDRVDRNVNNGAWATFGGMYGGALPIFPEAWPDNGAPFDPLSRRNITYSNDRDNADYQFSNTKNLGNAYLEITPIEGLAIRGEVGIDYTDLLHENWISGRLRVEEFREEDIGSDDRFFQDYHYDEGVSRWDWRDNDFITYNFIGTASYNTTIAEDHNITGLVGIETITNDSEQWWYELEDAGSNQDDKEVAAFIRDTDQFLALNHFQHGGARFYSQFGRLNYNYKGKYIFQGSIRRDGSSKFTPEDRFSWFPSLSAGWVVSDESFLNDNDLLSFLKVRGGWGVTGNANINPFLYINDFWVWPNYPNITGAQTLRQLGSRSIQWEKSNTIDAALEFGILNNRVSGSIGYYYTQTTDLLLSFPVAASIGIYETNGLNPSALDNVGSIENRGWEFELSTVNVNRGGFKWTTEFNFTTNQNKVLELYPGFDGDPLQFSFNGLTTIQVGEPLGMFFLPEFAGYDNSGNVLIREVNQELAEDQVYEFTGNNVRNIGNAANDNSVIQYGKTGLPTWFGGLNNTLTYKGLSLSFLFTFQGGHYIYDDMGLIRAGTGTSNLRADAIGNTWTPDNTDAQYPILTWANLENNPEDPDELPQSMSTRSTFWLEKGDMLRLRNVSLNYQLPKTLFDNNFLQGVNVFVNLNNVATFSAFDAVDPEVVNTGSATDRNIGQGVVGGVPFWQVFTAAGGLNVRF